jgi:hypothetical protein
MTDSNKRQCSECSKPDTEEPLFLIVMPPEIQERALFCKSCLLLAVDNSKRKNHVKQKEQQQQSKDDDKEYYYYYRLRNTISCIIDFSRVGEGRKFPAEEFADIILDLFDKNKA